MASSVLLSIVIPTYNSAKTLAISLESIASQTFRDFEVLLIDGVSKDSTLSVAQSYERKLPTLRMHSENDKGIYDAMNKGIELAQGKWLYFLGSDDYLATPTVLEDVFGRNKAIAESHDFIYGNVFWGNTSEIYLGKIDEYIIYRSNICHQAIFYRKEIFDITGKYDLHYPALADWKLNMQCLMDHRIRVAYLPLLVAHFAIDGSSKDFVDDFKKDKEEFYKSLLKTQKPSERIMKELVLFQPTAFRRKWLTLQFKWLRLLGK